MLYLSVVSIYLCDLFYKYDTGIHVYYNNIHLQSYKA